MIRYTIVQRRLGHPIYSLYHIARERIFRGFATETASKSAVPPQPSFGKTLLKVLPVCFVIGMGIEWFMINAKIGEVDFYSVAKRKEAERRLQLAREAELAQKHPPLLLQIWPETTENADVEKRHAEEPNGPPGPSSTHAAEQ